MHADTGISQHIHVTGIVQGVGFRPFIYNLAIDYNLHGWVLNAGDGVHIECSGERSVLEMFKNDISAKAPAAARVQKVTSKDIPLVTTPKNITVDGSFKIVASDDTTEKTTLVSPDIATCDACVSELFDLKNHRYHYPFINCTNCGPRFTIIKELPYDRPKTSMAAFPMCNQCAEEYGNPRDRRFHAQPDACFVCGPHLTWQAPESDKNVMAHTVTESDAFITAAVSALRRGCILAIKGLGGYHLVADATNEETVLELRRRKNRGRKPFAIMAPTLEDARVYCSVNSQEAELLCGSIRPIVLLQKNANPELETHEPLAHSLTYNLPEIGLMLPYTPVQHLLLHEFNGPLIMTSANISGEPIVINHQEATTKLGKIADGYLGNDRPIVRRYDDSVTRVVEGKIQMVRRARGYAPKPIGLPNKTKGEEILACGSEQKSTFTFVRGETAYISQHIGDLENYENFRTYKQTIDGYSTLFGVHPQIIAADMHPEYLATKWAKKKAQDESLTLISVQHHHAHIAAVAGENNVDSPVIGIALDGTGYGDDGAIWGGEVLWCSPHTFQRVAHLSYQPLPSGAGAVKHPTRCAVGSLYAYGLLDHPGAANMISRMDANEFGLAKQMCEKKLNAPLTSSAGRLLDAVSALLTICTLSTYEGEPAIALEAHAHTWEETLTEKEREEHVERAAEWYHLKNAEGSLSAEDALSKLLEAISLGESSNKIAWYFQVCLGANFARVALQAAHERNIDTIAVGGGVFMNRIILTIIRKTVREAGLKLIEPVDLPPNDGAISYGQAVVARNTLTT